MGRMSWFHIEEPVEPCPPHEWKDVSHDQWYILRCEKCMEVWPRD